MRGARAFVVLISAEENKLEPIWDGGLREKVKWEPVDFWHRGGEISA